MYILFYIKQIWCECARVCRKPARICTAFTLLGAVALISCKKDPPNGGDTPGDLSNIAYAPTPYTIVKPSHFPAIPIPDSNRMTVEGVQLGRRLFYDPMLSADSTQSCASCHFPQGSFTDNLAVSKGIDGIAGARSSMSLLNIAYATNGLFWDGRVRTLEQQALLPVEDPIEMHHTWTNALDKIRRHPRYPEMFRKAFGVDDRKKIDKFMAAKALAQFERILISSGTSKFDRYQQGNLNALDDDETDGRLMFFDEALSVGVRLPDAECFHCHGGITLTGNQYFNNGLDDVKNLADFKDKGRGAVTGNLTDNGKFRAPTLRNIALTAPYMHDGRFKTLNEVLTHYRKGGHDAPNEDPFVHPLGFPSGAGNLLRYEGFTDAFQRSLLKFLHTLTDTTFINNPDIQRPKD